MDSWHRLLVALGDAVPRLRLRPGVDEARLVEAEAALGIEFPEEYRAWLRLADGQGRGGLSIFPLCTWFASLDEVVACRQREVRNDAAARGDQRAPCAMPHGAHEHIRCRLHPSQRLTIAFGDDFEPLVALDLEHGRPSQVLVPWDADHLGVLFHSLPTYFDLIADNVARGNLVPLPHDDDGSEVLSTRSGGTSLGVIRTPAH